jgi:hypothetical protein
MMSFNVADLAAFDTRDAGTSNNGDYGPLTRAIPLAKIRAFHAFV